MGQFKPMVKMETTEPSVELKLKKGGTVGHKKMKSGGTCKMTGHKMMDGGMAPTIGTPMGGLAPSMPPAKPSLAARRAAMSKPAVKVTPKRGAMKPRATPPKGAPVVIPPMKTGGVVKGQGGYKTGGVVKGQGGYAEGGIIKSTTGKTKVVTANADNSPAKTGDVKLGNGGGYKKGGSTKKFAEGGSVNDAGRPQKMAQGAKKPSSAVAINQLSGTFKKGGKVKKYASGGLSSPAQDMINNAYQANLNKANKTKALLAKIPVIGSKLSDAVPMPTPIDFSRVPKPIGMKKGGKSLQAVFKKENAPAMKAAKADSNLKYSKYQKMQKFADGGTVDAVDPTVMVDPTVSIDPVEYTMPPIDSTVDMPQYDTTGTPIMYATGAVPTGVSPRGTSPVERGGLGKMRNHPELHRMMETRRLAKAAEMRGRDMDDDRGRFERRVRPNPMPITTPAFPAKLTPKATRKVAEVKPRMAMKKGGKVRKMAGGGSSYDEGFASPAEQLAEMRKRKAMEQGYTGTRERDTASNEALLDSLTSLPASVKAMVRKALRGQGAVTDTQTTVSRTVTPPAKKRGGKVRK